MKQKKKKKGRQELEKKTKHNGRLIKDKIMRDVRRIFEQEEDYYKPKSANNFWNSNYIEYESNGDKNRNLLLDECLNNIKPCFRNGIDLQNLVYENAVNNCN